MLKGNGEEHNSEDVHGDLVRDMKSRIETKNATEFREKLNTFIGGVTGFFFGTFFVPFLIVYAYNGMQPAVWPDISYLPTLAGLFVFRVLINMLRSE